MATYRVGSAASAWAYLYSASQDNWDEWIFKHMSKMSRRARKSYTDTARDCRACLARVLYSMRHACSTRSLGHANVRKTCSVNSGHRFVPIPLPGIRQRHACAIRLLRAPWLRLTLRRSPSSSVLTLSRADVLVVLAGRRRRKRGFKARSEPRLPRVGSREAPPDEFQILSKLPGQGPLVLAGEFWRRTVVESGRVWRQSR